MGMTYATVNGQQIYYEVRGSGRPLVLLHGGLQTIELSVGPLLEPLAKTRQVIAVELQGHGRTPHSDRPLSPEALAGDVVALLDDLGIKQADLFGFSLGAMVGYEIARHHPGRLGKLIAASADPRLPAGRESVLAQPELLPTREDFESWQAAYRAVAPEPDRFGETAANTGGMVQQTEPWPDEQVRGLRVPILLMFGDRDFWPLADVADLASVLPDAQVAVLPGATHMGVMQYPEQVLALVAPFLDAPASPA
jgi:pimeloyl-ACP methyl ester carboxylesterase